ncbi:MAG: ECF transporter S component [Clostridium sp.]
MKSKQQNSCTCKKITTDKLVKISILSAVSFVIMMLDFPLPIFPVFLQIDLSDIPALIGGFAMGPIVGVIIELVKNILHLLTTSTAGIGEIANFIVGGVFVYVSAAIYRRKKTKKRAIISLFIGIVVMSLVACIFNYFILIPLYESALNIPITATIALAATVTSLINSLETLILYSILPFNILKGTIVSIVVLLIYKKVEPIIKPKCN